MLEVLGSQQRFADRKLDVILPGDQVHIGTEAAALDTAGVVPGVVRTAADTKGAGPRLIEAVA